MIETWIDLPQAVDRLAKAQGIDAIAARPALLDLIIAGGVATRIRLRQGFSVDGAPDLDEPLHSAYWRDLSDLKGGWWETGIADFGRGYSYRGIQVREADLDIQMGVFNHGAPKPETTIQAMATGRRRGPKNKYDWEAAFAHIIAVADGKDGLHPDGEGKADVPFLTSMLADWFSAKHPDGDYPSDTILREKATKIHDALIRKVT